MGEPVLARTKSLNSSSGERPVDSLPSTRKVAASRAFLLGFLAGLSEEVFFS
jgi:lipase chaperone LimK